MKSFFQPRKRPPRTVPGSTEDILAYLDKYGVQDKDRVSSAPAKRARLQFPIEKLSNGTLRLRVDLHGLIADEAERRFRFAVQFSLEHGIRELLVIHGHGVHSAPSEGPVLKNLVRMMLESELCDRVRDYRTGVPKEGGEGVTVVYLK
jgi:DNA-nicking Smr family endonuclease